MDKNSAKTLDCETACVDSTLESLITEITAYHTNTPLHHEMINKIVCQKFDILFIL